MNKLKSLLVATDFSDDAGRAVRRAARLGADLSGHLHLLHVMSGPSLSALRDLFPNPAEAEAKICSDALRMLDEHAAKLEGIDRGSVTTQVKVGRVLDEILLACGQADLLVLGAHGWNPLRDVILGTTAERLLRKSPCPVLVAKQEPRGPYRQVLVPVDFSPHSSKALKVAMQVAPGAKIVLAHAFDVPFEGKLWLAGVKEEEIHRYRIHAREQALSQVAALMRDVGGGSSRISHMVEHGDAPRLILAKEEELSADLIVMGKHGQSVAEELFLGSVTRHVLSDAKCDVLVVHGEA